MQPEPTPERIEGSLRVNAAREDERWRVTMERDIEGIAERQREDDRARKELRESHEKIITLVGNTNTMLHEHLNQVRDRDEYQRLVRVEDVVRGLQRKDGDKSAVTLDEERKARRKEQILKMLADLAKIAATIGGLYGILQVS